MALKKVSILLCCAAAVLTVCTALFLTLARFPAAGKNNIGFFRKEYVQVILPQMQRQVKKAAPRRATLASDSDLYIVKEYKGHIGVYRNGEKTPFREYQTDVAVLPKADQTALKQGKVLHSMAEVEKLVEDYDG